MSNAVVIDVESKPNAEPLNFTNIIAKMASEFSVTDRGDGGKEEAANDDGQASRCDEERPNAGLVPVWPENCAAVPTELTRTSIFQLVGDRIRDGKNKRDDKKDIVMKKILESRSDVHIEYTGQLLDAKDETTYYACLRLNRGLPFGQRLHLRITDLLNEMGLTNTGGKAGNRKILINRLERLSTASLLIKFKRKNEQITVTTGLLKFGLTEPSGMMYIRIDPDAARLFENLSYQPWSIRISLKSDMAARLLTYISGHAQGKSHYISSVDLAAWLGYHGRPDHFLKGIKKALLQLEEAGVVDPGWAVGKLKVSWTRPPASAKKE